MGNFHHRQRVVGRPGQALPIVALLLITGPEATFSAEVTIVDERPVATMVESLEKEFGVPITYEDPPYLFANDFADATANTASPESVAKSKRVNVSLKARRLRFNNTAATTGGDLDALTQTIQNALTANNEDSPPGIFELSRTVGRFHVYPKNVKDKFGQYVPYTSLLDVPISIEAQDRNGRDFISEFCAAVARASNSQFGPPPFGSWSYWRQQRTSLGAAGRTGREVLLQFLDLLESRQSVPGARFSWSILHPIAGEHPTLTIHLVRTREGVVTKLPRQNAPVANPPPQNTTRSDGASTPRRPMK